MKAAQNLIHRLRSEKPSLVQSMERLCEAYIDLAYHDVSSHRKERKPIKFPASCTLIKLAGQLKEVAVPTLEIEVNFITQNLGLTNNPVPTSPFPSPPPPPPLSLSSKVDPSCTYSHLVTIDQFDTHFQLAGGINLPKVLSCIGSDGKRRRQLVKVIITPFNDNT